MEEIIKVGIVSLDMIYNMLRIYRLKWIAIYFLGVLQLY